MAASEEQRKEAERVGRARGGPLPGDPGGRGETDKQQAGEARERGAGEKGKETPRWGADKKRIPKLQNVKGPWPKWVRVKATVRGSGVGSENPGRVKQQTASESLLATEIKWGVGERTAVDFCFPFPCQSFFWNGGRERYPGQSFFAQPVRFPPCDCSGLVRSGWP